MKVKKRKSKNHDAWRSMAVGNYHRAAMIFMDSMNSSPIYEEKLASRNAFLNAVYLDVSLPY